jgi:hypothetical protein
MAKYNEYSEYDSIYDSKFEIGTEYMTEDLHNGSDGSASKDSGGFSMK